MIVITDAGRRAMLDGLVADPLTLRLFSNAVDVGPETGPDAFTEPVVDGYHPIALSAWQPTPEGIGATHAPVRFSFLGTGQIAGYFVTNAAGAVVAAESLDPSTVRSRDTLDIGVTLMVAGSA